MYFAHDPVSGDLLEQVQKFTHLLLKLQKLVILKKKDRLEKIYPKRKFSQSEVVYTEYLKPWNPTLATSSRTAVSQIFEPMTPGEEQGSKSAESYMVELLFMYFERKIDARCLRTNTVNCCYIAGLDTR